jgi:hypothetical protein
MQMLVWFTVRIHFIVRRLIGGDMDGDMPRVYTETHPRAAREHQCCECRRIIKVGEKYHKAKGCWGGGWAEYKTCEECNDLRHEANDPYYGMPPFGYLGEWAGEAGVDFPVVA